MSFNKPKIYNLKDLINALKVKGDGESYTSVLNEIQFSFKEIEHLCFWDQDNYSKISIEKGERYELVLICWEKGQKSPVHDHNLDEAWTYILKGELTEDIYIENKEDSTLDETVILSTKAISSIKPVNKKVHRLKNTYNGRSVSLHLYKK